MIIVLKLPTRLKNWVTGAGCVFKKNIIDTRRLYSQMN